jgi:hypothetical protein
MVSYTLMSSETDFAKRKKLFDDMIIKARAQYKDCSVSILKEVDKRTLSTSTEYTYTFGSNDSTKA